MAARVIWLGKKRVLRTGYVQRFRNERFNAFRRELAVTDSHRIVDVGGGSGAGLATRAPHNPIVAVDMRPLEPATANVTTVQASATNLPFADNEFDIAFSNSMIEHMQPDARRLAAQEIMRVAPAYWVQTPNKWFPIEPHYMLPFFQFLPARLRHYYDQRFHDDWIQLLTERELRQLFPDGEVYRERFLGMTKSLVVFRRR